MGPGWAGSSRYAATAQPAASRFGPKQDLVESPCAWPPTSVWSTAVRTRRRTTPFEGGRKSGALGPYADRILKHAAGGGSFKMNQDDAIRTMRANWVVYYKEDPLRGYARANSGRWGVV